MAETQTVAKERSAPKSLAEKEAEFTEWKAQRAVRDLRKEVKIQIALLAKNLDACTSTEDIRKMWATTDAVIDGIVRPPKNNADP